MVFKRYETILIYMCGMMTYHFFHFIPLSNVVHTLCILFHTTIIISYPTVFISYYNVGISYPSMTTYVFDFHGCFIPYLSSFIP